MIPGEVAVWARDYLFAARMHLRGNLDPRPPSLTGPPGARVHVVLIPGVVTTTNDVVTGTTTMQFPIHGGRSSEGRLKLDGIIIGSPSNSPTSYVVDAGATEEVTFTGASGLGETETGGLVMNLVPKTGGNSTHGVGRGFHLP